MIVVFAKPVHAVSARGGPPGPNHGPFTAKPSSTALCGWPHPPPLVHLFCWHRTHVPAHRIFSVQCAMWCNCDGLLIIMIYISPLMRSVCFSLFGCFCRLGCCGVHVLVNTSFLYRIGQVHKFAGFLCLCITFRLCQYLIFILRFSC